MTKNYEIIHYKQGLNTRLVMHNVNHFKLHWHKEIELLLVLKGQIQVNISGSNYTVKEDELFLINSGELHSTTGNGNNTVVALQINTDCYQKTFPELRNLLITFENSPLQDPDHPICHEIRTLIAKIVSEYSKSLEGYQLAIESLLNSLLLLIVRNLPKISKQETLSASHDKDFARIEYMIDYVDNHYTEKLSLAVLAKKVFLSTSYLSRFFKEKVGMTFQEYLTHVRLRHAVHQLESTTNLIGDISLDCGFVSTKAFNKSFRDTYGLTPSEYRTSNSSLTTDANSATPYMEFDSVQAMAKLQQYLESVSYSATLSTLFSAPTHEATFKINTLAKPKEYWNNSFTKLATVGRAYDCLRADLQAQIAEGVQSLGFTHLRFHGIFSDEMRIITRHSNGQLNFSWQYVDKIFDFLLSLGVHPFPDLTFMPSELKSGDANIFHYSSNATPPADIEEWMLLVESFARHCIQRYGVNEVRQWYFEIWNEPNYELFWTGSQQEFFAFVDATICALHKVDASLQIAGPSTLPPIGKSDDWFEDFVEHMNQHKQPLDALTFHLYGELALNPDEPSVHGKDASLHWTLNYLKEVKNLHIPVSKVFITEFNMTAFHGNYLLDTMVPACFLAYNALRIANLVDGVGVWTLSDIMEESFEPYSPFHGNFGLMTSNGIRKPAWYAMWFLKRLGTEVLEKGEEHIVTRQGNSYQILAFSYADFDKMYTKGDRSLLTFHDRYSVFKERSDLKFIFNLSDLTGKYKITRYRLDREHGSAWDLYEKMGAPEYLTKEHSDWLRAMAQPTIDITHKQIKDTLDLEINLPLHGLCFLQIDPC